MFCWIELASFPGAKFAIIIYPETDFFSDLLDVAGRTAIVCWTRWMLPDVLLNVLDAENKLKTKKNEITWIIQRKPLYLQTEYNDNVIY